MQNVVLSSNKPLNLELYKLFVMQSAKKNKSCIKN